MAKGIGTKVKLEGEKEFTSAIRNINSDMSVLGSELKKVASEFDDNGKSMSDLAKKQEVLDKTYDKQAEKVEALRKALENAKEQYPDNTKKLNDWQKQLNYAEADLNKLGKEVKDNKDNMEKADKPTEKLGKEIKKVGDKAEKAGKDTLKMGDIIKANLISEGIIKGVGALASAFAGIGSAIIDSVEETKEYRGELSILSENADKAGLSFDGAKDKLSNMVAVTKDSGAAVEGLSNLMAAGLDEQGMTDAVDALSGAIIKFPDTLKFEGLADGLQETLATGKAVGTFGELIERSGGNLEDFDKQMEKATTAAEKQQVALDWLNNSGLKELNESYRENNSAMLDAEKAQFKLNDAMAGLATVVEPMVANVKGGFADMLSGIVGVVEGTEGSTEQLKEGMASFTDSIMETVDTVLPIILDVVKTVLPEMADMLIGEIGLLVETAYEIFVALTDAFLENLPMIVELALDIMTNLVTGLLVALPQIIETGMIVLTSLIEGITNELPYLIPLMVDTILLIVDTLIDNIDMLIDASIAIILALADGLILALPKLIDKAPVIVQKLVDALIKNGPKLLTAAGELIGKLVIGLIDNLPKLVTAAFKIVDSVKTGIVDFKDRMMDAGSQLVSGLWNGIVDKTEWIKEKVKGFGTSVLNAVKGVFGIQSPSTVFRDQVGKNLALGLGEGFTDEMKHVNDEMSKSIPTSFDAEFSVSGKSSLKGKGFAGSLSISGNNFIINNEMDIEYVAQELAYRTQRQLGGGGLAYA